MTGIFNLCKYIFFVFYYSRFPGFFDTISSQISCILGDLSLQMMARKSNRFPRTILSLMIPSGRRLLNLLTDGYSLSLPFGLFGATCYFFRSLVSGPFQAIICVLIFLLGKLVSL